MGDMETLVETVKEANPAGSDQAGMTTRLLTGGFTLRDLYEQFANIMKVPPLPSTCLAA
jgi:signal recognition particle GTPase